MSHEETRRLLDEYVDGALPARRRRQVEDHLASCGECRDELGRLGRFLDTSLALRGRVTQPKSDLWPLIHRRITEQTEAGTAADGEAGPAPAGTSSTASGAAPMGESSMRGRAGSRWRSFWARRFMGRPIPIPTVWASAILLIAITTYAYLSHYRSQGLDASSIDGLGVLEAETSVARDDYRNLLQTHGEEMPPEAGSQFQQNLDLLDQAIRDSRAALEADPRNPALQRSLLGVYEKQLSLLRWATRILEQA